MPKTKSSIGSGARSRIRTSSGSPRVKDVRRRSPSAPTSVTSVISTSRDPQRPSVARNMSAGAGRGLDRMVGQHGRRRLVGRRSPPTPTPAPRASAAASCLFLGCLDVGDVGADDALADRRCPCMRPASSHSASSQNRSTRPSECVTSRIVLPRRLNSRELVEALVGEALVADGQHLVDQQHVGIDVDRHGEPEAHVHARRVGLDRRVDELLAARRTRRSRRSAARSRASVRPSMMPLMKTFSRPEISGWNPAPSSISAEMRPSTVTVPVVGLVMPATQLQQRALARSVAADDAERRARRARRRRRPCSAANVSSGLQIADQAAATAARSSASRTASVAVAAVDLRDVADLDGRVAAMHHTSSANESRRRSKRK